MQSLPRTPRRASLQSTQPQPLRRSVSFCGQTLRSIHHLRRYSVPSRSWCIGPRRTSPGTSGATFHIECCLGAARPRRVRLCAAPAILRPFSSTSAVTALAKQLSEIFDAFSSREAHCQMRGKHFLDRAVDLAIQCLWRREWSAFPPRYDDGISQVCAMEARCLHPSSGGLVRAGALRPRHRRNARNIRKRAKVVASRKIAARV